MITVCIFLQILYSLLTLILPTQLDFEKFTYIPLREVETAIHLADEYIHSKLRQNLFRHKKIGCSTFVQSSFAVNKILRSKEGALSDTD